MAKVLVVCEQRSGKLKKASLEIVGALAKAGGHDVSALVIGSGVGGLAGDLGKYGAKKVLVAENAKLAEYTGEGYTLAVEAAAKAISPDWILGSHTPMGRDLMARASGVLGVGLASDCTVASFSGDLKVRRPVYAGKATAEVEFLGSGPKIATIRPNALGTPTAAGGSAETVAVTVDLGGAKSTFVEAVKGSSARPDVTEAAIVISGGRSMKNAENFKIIEEMADVVGGAVGASRAAVDAGFRPHRDQVGQTGKTVSPNLYIACGISGAIQHLAGMRTSKCIVAINTDPEAPIFQVADYGIVADMFQVIPALTAEFKKAKE